MLDKYRDDPRVTPNPDGTVTIAAADGTWIGVQTQLFGWVPTRTGSLDEPVTEPGRLFVVQQSGYDVNVGGQTRSVDVGYDTPDDLADALLGWPLANTQAA